jgi:hypothetical protein
VIDYNIVTTSYCYSRKYVSHNPHCLLSFLFLNVKKFSPSFSVLLGLLYLKHSLQLNQKNYFLMNILFERLDFSKFNHFKLNFHIFYVKRDNSCFTLITIPTKVRKQAKWSIWHIFSFYWIEKFEIKACINIILYETQHNPLIINFKHIFVFLSIKKNTFVYRTLDTKLPGHTKVHSLNIAYVLFQILDSIW